jgi:hypothetical protein
MPDDDPTPDTDDRPDDNKPDPPAPPPNKPAADKDWQAEADKWKALARKHEKAAADLEPFARKARELEEAGKTAEERIANERDSHRTRADKAESEVLRLRVALGKGLTATQAKRLVGTTEEELEADADELLASFRPPDPSGKETPASGRTKERLRPGAVPDAEPVELNPAKLAQMVSRGQF